LSEPFPPATPLAGAFRPVVAEWKLPQRSRAEPSQLRAGLVDDGVADAVVQRQHDVEAGSPVGTCWSPAVISEQHNLAPRAAPLLEQRAAGDSQARVVLESLDQTGEVVGLERDVGVEL